MRYVGGKHILAKRIAQHLRRWHNLPYWEPFVGGGSVLEAVMIGNRPRLAIASDIDFQLIDMWSQAAKGWKPPIKISEEEFRAAIGNNPGMYPHLRAFIKYGCSFAGKGTVFARDHQTGRNFAAESARNVERIAAVCHNVQFLAGDFIYGGIPYPVTQHRFLIYCDPPYMDVDYDYDKDFDQKKFWEKCRYLAQYHVVVVSGHVCPSDFGAIADFQKRVDDGWSKVRNTSVRTEKLFLHIGSRTRQ